MLAVFSANREVVLCFLSSFSFGTLSSSGELVEHFVDLVRTGYCAGKGGTAIRRPIPEFSVLLCPANI